MLEERTLSELTENLPAILTIKDTASFLNCSSLTVRRLIRENALRAYQIPEDRNQWNISRHDFLDYLSRHSNL
ncbi:helix-turn-helix domain-containing protein [Breznakiella homolactica]|uniref:Helix-turn-helix domain-containing protein n=1 Tax=Breznakiella homolactica TaxID=2798577 RepID=A0A7T8BB26_9SPIR|nr:helix-turn-helix domain-containing protein [Breznakiella homolactica]QQO10112.1 helix-turn-helix domain-containing protein [Breznakiella homolactica]